MFKVRGKIQAFNGATSYPPALLIKGSAEKDLHTFSVSLELLAKPELLGDICLDDEFEITIQKVQKS